MVILGQMVVKWSRNGQKWSVWVKGGSLVKALFERPIIPK